MFIITSNNKTPQSTILGGACAEPRHSTKNLWTAWFEKGVMIYGDFINTLGGFYHYRVVVYTHCQHAFMFKQLVKVKFASDDCFKRSLTLFSCIFCCLLSHICSGLHHHHVSLPVCRHVRGRWARSSDDAGGSLDGSGGEGSETEEKHEWSKKHDTCTHFLFFLSNTLTTCVFDTGIFYFDTIPYIIINIQ